MTLQKAIKIVTYQYRGNYTKADPDLGAATQLLIEAGKRIQKGRKVDHAFACVQLPGETPD